MRATVLALIFASPVTASWPHWLPDPFSTTTTFAPLTHHMLKDFARGFADELGFDDGITCLQDVNGSAVDFYEAGQDYFKGGWENKAKALVKFGEASKTLMEALKPCNTEISDDKKLMKLVKELEDPKYYTMHNAFTLLLNAIDEKGELKAFAASWQKKDYYGAGKDFMTALLDILENADIPQKNGTAAIKFAQGFAEGFSSSFDLDCFKDVRVELPAAISGVLDLLSLKLLSGLENIFQALTGAVPTYKDCMAEKKSIMGLLHTFGDFAHPKEMAKVIAENVLNHDVDLTQEVAAAVLDYKFKEWQRFGQDVGRILEHIIVATNNTKTTSTTTKPPTTSSSPQDLMV